MIPLKAMDELKILFWIIIGLVYLFSRRKKKPEPPASPGRTVETDQGYDAPSPNKPLTFEELLREIQGGKKPELAPPTLPSPHSYNRPPAKREWEKEPVDYDDDLVEERKDLEDTNYDYRKHDKIYEIYDNATKQAFNRPSLEETMKLEDTIVRFKPSKGYETMSKSHLTEDILKELKDPKGFRKAFILSEILNRRF